MSESPPKLLPLPRPAAPIPVLTAAEKCNWSKLEQHRRQNMETVLLPFWHGMGAVYAAILADNEGNESDGLTLTATIEDWPQSFETQQHALFGLMDKSKLRQAWRSEARWQLEQMANFTEGQLAVQAALQKEDADSARPLREIPFYWISVRASCQQVICMPVRQWDAMFSQNARYEPTSVDKDVVEKLATRIARALNAPFSPPRKPREINADPDRPWAGRFDFPAAPDQPVVWNTDPRSLLRSIDGHGMNDRLFDEYLRPIEHEPDQIPSWRFDGFCGQLRVTGIGDEPWYVTVLAPVHFVGALVAIITEYEQ